MTTLTEKSISRLKLLAYILAGTVATAAIVSLVNLQMNITANQKRLEQDVKLQKILDERKRDEIKQNQETIKKELEKQIEALKQQAEAKKAQTIASAAKAAQSVATRVVPHAQASGGCGEWIAAAGITDTANAIWLINKESGCRTTAVNPSSGACGIPQALPCSKLGAARGNPVEELKWMNTYVIARYGSWANAVAFHQRNNWY